MALPARDWRHDWPEWMRRRLRAWLWALAFTTAAVLVVGGITRLTRSGLSIVEWQPIAGAIPPIGPQAWEERFRQYQQFAEYRQIRPGMTLDQFKLIFFWEYLHRLLARGIGLVFLVPFIAFWRAGAITRPLARRTALLATLGAAQGAMGWWMVRSGLADRPTVSHYRLAAHFALALVIFAAAVWMARDLAVRRRPIAINASVRTTMRRGLVGIGALLGLQIVWGALVAGLKAGLLFNTFPLMAGRLVPPQIFALDPPLVNLVQNPAAVQWVHRLIGTLLAAAALAFFMRARRTGLDARSAALNRLLAAAICTQYAIGILTLVLGVPVPVAVLHQITALAIVAIWVTWMHHVHNLSAAAPA